MGALQSSEAEKTPFMFPPDFTPQKVWKEVQESEKITSEVAILRKKVFEESKKTFDIQLDVTYFADHTITIVAKELEQNWEVYRSIDKYKNVKLIVKPKKEAALTQRINTTISYS